MVLKIELLKIHSKQENNNKLILLNKKINLILDN